MRRRIRWLLGLTVAIAVGIQCVRPARTNPASDPALALLAHLPVPSDVVDLLNRSCRDCHSNETQWPWYSGVAPVSWFVIDHVNHGRTHFNYSDWGRYTPERTIELLEQSCTLVRDGSMPLDTYRLMHSRARVSPADAERLCRWTADAVLSRRRLIR